MEEGEVDLNETAPSRWKITAGDTDPELWCPSCGSRDVLSVPEWSTIGTLFELIEKHREAKHAS